MGNKKIKSICEDYFAFCKSENIGVSKKQIAIKIYKAIKESKENYLELTDPKSCPLDVYTEIWVKQLVSYFLAKKSVKPIKLNHPLSSFKLSAEFHLLFPEELITKYGKIVFDTPQEERDKVWKKISLGLDLKEFEKRFKNMIKERIKFAKDRRYQSRLDMALTKYKIPKKDYTRFVKNTDRVIDICNKKLSSVKNLPDWFFFEFNIPCYVCQLHKFPFNSIQKVFKKVVSMNKTLEKFEQKITLTYKDEKSSMSYKKESDSFEITVNKTNNFRHQACDLIHELSHVIVYLNYFKKEINPLDVGTYQREKEAIQNEEKILKDISLDLYKTLLYNEMLISIQQTIFEIELYKNVNQDLAKLYASTFNKSYKKAKQISNYSYILNKEVIYKSFFILPHTVAGSNVILDLEE